MTHFNKYQKPKNMTNKITLILLILISIKSLAQESVVFQAEFQPNKKYVNNLNSNSHIQINFIADEEVLARIKGTGMELPMIMETEMNTVTQLITQERNVKGELPAIMEYKKMTMVNTFNGETTTTENPYKGMKVIGKYDINNKYTIDTIIGELLAPELRKGIIGMLDEVQKSIKFPEKPMRIGDRFKNEIPLEIPLENMNPLSVIIKMEYILTEINGNMAYFDILQFVGIDNKQNQINFTAKGSGSGMAEYNIAEKCVTKFNSALPMEMSINMDEKITMEMKMETLSQHNVEIQ